MEVTALTPYSKVEWRCIKAMEEWIGTTLTFELEPHQKGMGRNTFWRSHFAIAITH